MPSPHSSTYDVTTFNGSVSASQDIGLVINEIIADIKANQTSQTSKPGGDIFIPVGDYNLLTQIVIDISYLTIRGKVTASHLSAYATTHRIPPTGEKQLPAAATSRSNSLVHQPSLRVATGLNHVFRV